MKSPAPFKLGDLVRPLPLRPGGRQDSQGLIGVVIDMGYDPSWLSNDWSVDVHWSNGRLTYWMSCDLEPVGEAVG